MWWTRVLRAAAEHTAHVLETLSEIGAARDAPDSGAEQSRSDSGRIRTRPALARRILGDPEHQPAGAVAISARTGAGLEALLAENRRNFAARSAVSTAFSVSPSPKAGPLHLLHEYGRVLPTSYDEDICEVDALAPESLRRRLAKYLRNGLRLRREYYVNIGMNLPNLLTLLRIFFVPLLVATLLAAGFRRRWQQLIPGLARDLFALAIFLAAAATDLLDGYLARRWRQVTTVGTLLDPIADKLLISAALISLVDIHRVPAWMVILIIGREFAVSGCGRSRRPRAIPFAPAIWAKPR